MEYDVSILPHISVKEAYFLSSTNSKKHRLVYSVSYLIRSYKANIDSFRSLTHNKSIRNIPSSSSLISLNLMDTGNIKNISYLTNLTYLDLTGKEHLFQQYQLIFLLLPVLLNLI